jgi:hypothetical protein
VKVKTFKGNEHSVTISDVTRAETTFITRDGQQYTVFILDAEDELSMVVHYPNSEREIVWSLTKGDIGSSFTDE